MSARAYRGYATVISFIDGDTFRGVLDQGLDTHVGNPNNRPPRFRCAIIDTPETKGEARAAGLESLLYAQRLFPMGEYECWYYKRDEYGRPLVDLIHPGSGRQFSDLMLAAGMAVPYKP